MPLFSRSQLIFISGFIGAMRPITASLLISCLCVPLQAFPNELCDVNAAQAAYRTLEKTDREVREQYGVALQKKLHDAKKRGTPLSDAEMVALGEPMRKVDSQNQIQLAELITQCGWPTYETWGATPVRAAFLVTQHAPLPFKKKYQSNIDEAFRRGDIRPHLYALFVDRVLLAEGKLQLYGTQLRLERDGTETMQPLEDPAHLNDRRQALGMDLHGAYPMPSNWPSSVPQAVPPESSTNDNRAPAGTATK